MCRKMNKRCEDYGMSEWVITCNSKVYNVVGAFNKLNMVDWKQSTNVQVGDIIYIYVGAPIRAISFKCEVIKVDQSEELIDDSEFVLDDSNYGNYGRYMRLRLLEKYNDKNLEYDCLMANGLKTVQGPSKVSEELSDYLKNVISQNQKAVSEEMLLIGRPFEGAKADKDVQEERDKAYPKDYVTKLGITIGAWKELLSTPEIFKETDIELLKRFYKADNHATTCHDLAIQDGVSPASFISPVVLLAKRISSALKLSPIIGDDGTQIWWRIPFWGRYREDGKFEWKLRPKLAKALVALYPELDKEAGFDAEKEEDNSLIEELKQANVVTLEPFSYSGVPKEKAAPIYTNGHKTYPRDRQTAINALAHANYECEIDINHQTFIRKKSNLKYTEPHHLIPMAFSDEFEVSLDVEENIVSLCSNCHNQIHYGKDADKLITKLYEERKNNLKKVGIVISLNRLLAMYGYSN